MQSTLTYLLLALLSCSFLTATELKANFDQFKKEDFLSSNIKLISHSVAVKVGQFTGQEYAQWKTLIPKNCDGFTINLTIYPENINSGDVVTCHNESSNQRAFRLNIWRGRIYFSVNSNGKAPTPQGISLPIKKAVWQNIKAEFRPGELKLSVDDKTVTRPGVKYFFHAQFPITIGMYATHQKLMRPYIGLIKDIRIRFGNATKLFSSPQYNNILKSQDFKALNGIWQIKNGVAQPVPNKNDKKYILLWNKLLPSDNYRVDFEINLQNKRNNFVPTAYLLVKGKSDGSGIGFGLEREGKRQIKCKKIPQNVRLGMCFSQSGFSNGNEWQKFTIIVKGNCFELHNTELLMRDYHTQFSAPNLNRLLLYTNDAQTKFRNISVMTLENSGSVPQIEFTTPSYDNFAFNQYRPIFKWLPRGINRIDDLNYRIEIKKYPKLELIESSDTADFQFRPIHALKPGRYLLTLTSQNFAGDIWGGQISTNFIIKANPASVKDDGIIIIQSDTPQIFSVARPQIELKWTEHKTLNRVVGYLGHHQIFDYRNLAKKNQLEFIPNIDLTPGLNTITLKFYAGQRLIDSHNYYIVRSKIPVKYEISSTGALTCQGKKLAPFGTYRDPSDDYMQVSGVKEAGFNFTHSYHFEEGHYFKNAERSVIFPYNFSREKLQEKINDAKKYLQLCHKNNLKVALGIKRHWVHFERTDLIREFVAALMGEPALMMWYLYDEADWCQVPIPSLKKSYETIKKLDPYHPVIGIFAQHSWIPRYARCCDILWSQSYGSNPRHVINHINDMLKMRQLAAQWQKSRSINSQSCWVILGAHDLKFKQKGFKNHNPSPQQIEANLFAALTTQIKGIVYYWLPRTSYDIKLQTPEIWQSVISAGKITNKVLPLLLAPGKDLAVKSDMMGIVARVRKLESGQKIIVLLNTANKKLSYQIAIQNNQQVIQLGGNSQFHVKNKQLNIQLAPESGCALLLK